MASPQNTIGLISHDFEESYDGFNLLYPHNQSTVFLIDSCGQIVHSWDGDSEERPGLTAYILENGDLLKTQRTSSIEAPIWAGGAGEAVEQRTWDNQLLWLFELNDSTARLHHDIAPLPDGNVLMIAWESKTEDEAITAGRNPALLSQGKLWPDYILEYDPTLDTVIWEWHAWDHLIQDFDESKENYGPISQHPELIDINWDNHNGHPDWMHTNAIDFNVFLNQIAISVPYFNEIWVIDHSTTMEEAAGHTGGNSNKGGDLLYRWGNPATYKAGDSADQFFFFQHDINWIYPNASFDHPDFNKMAVFNNRVGPLTSTSNIFTPDFDTINFQYLMNIDQTFGPDDFERTIIHPENNINAFSNALSSVQILPNGNALICSGRWGYSFEITPEEKIVWEYITPITEGARATQGDILSINQNVTFRLKRYDPSYSAFIGRDLTPQGFIELNPNEDFCNQLVLIEENYLNRDIKIYPNPGTDFLIVDFPHQPVSLNLEIYNIQGQLVSSNTNIVSGERVNISFLPRGIYFISYGSGQRHYRFVKE